MRKSIYLTDPIIKKESEAISKDMGISFSSLVQLALGQLIDNYHQEIETEKRKVK